MFDNITNTNNKMHPKQTLINKAKSDGIIDYATTLISASHLVNSVAYTLVEEANEEFKNYGLMLGEIKLASSQLQKSFDRFFNEINLLIKNSQSPEKAKEVTIDYAKDFDLFLAATKKALKLPDCPTKKE